MEFLNLVGLKTRVIIETSTEARFNNKGSLQPVHIAKHLRVIQIQIKLLKEIPLMRFTKQTILVFPLRRLRLKRTPSTMLKIRQINVLMHFG